MAREARRLSVASVKSWLSGICAPVRMTVLLRKVQSQLLDP